ncbi:MAG TPA: cbb3-type cytochrome c oxidase N-terminal domain-containing protein [Candidatus Eisenbacteria bacterium]
MTETHSGGPEEDRLLDHEVDGIREYDNPMPRWWLYILYATILYAVIYALNIIPGVGTGPGRIANYETEMAALRTARQASAASTGPVTPEAILAVVADAGALSKGRERFKATCAPCHREDGGGNIGPNLTDDFWIHGGQPLQILTTVNEGVVAKGMPAWGQVLKPEEITAVVAYVTTLHGTNPANAKAPQGDRAIAGQASAGADSATASP